MGNQRGLGFLHILLIVVLVGVGAGVWKYQQRKSVESIKLVAGQKAIESVVEQRQLAEINSRVEESHRQELEIQRRVYQSLNKELPIPDQSDMTSKSLPYLEWKATSIDMTKAGVEEFSKAALILISKSLKDPDSAKYSDLKILKASHSDGSYTFLCGKVNAKNSFGGYTGFQDFIVHRGESNTIEGGVGDTGKIAVVQSEGKWWRYDGDEMCIVHGIPF